MEIATTRNRNFSILAHPNRESPFLYKEKIKNIGFSAILIDKETMIVDFFKFFAEYIDMIIQR